jgi:ankyrin repeat protein
VDSAANVKTFNIFGILFTLHALIHDNRACAYGVEPLVIKLVEAGADVNSTNCYGYTPLLEACHRGFIAICAQLVAGGAKLNYIPPEDLSSASPFVSSPAQSALGEAARCGFSKIVKVNNNDSC